jgi:hypothetical protein
MTTNKQGFQLPITSGKTFTRETIRIDGHRFENCKFVECTLIYEGGPAEASACEFSPKMAWQLQGAAGMTIQTLQRFGWKFEYGGEAPISIPVTPPQ